MQFWNVALPMDLSPLENITDLSETAFLNAIFPRAVTVSGITMLSRDEQLSKALFPIVSSPSFKVIDFKAVQFANANASISSIPECRVIVFSAVQPENVY